MASPSSGSARGRSARGGRSAPPPKSPLPIVIGVAVVLVVVLVIAMNRNGSTPANAGQAEPKPAAQQPAAAPAAVVGAKVQIAAAKKGKPPTTPPPSLSEATLQELSDLIARVKAVRNESVTARTTQGDNQAARQKMTEAKALLSQWLAKVEAPLRWQESAQMEDWSQPAEYATLEQLYAQYQRLENEVRKGGG